MCAICASAVCCYSDLVHRLFSLMRVFSLSPRVGRRSERVLLFSWRAEGVWHAHLPERSKISRAPKLLEARTHTHRRRRRRSLRSQLVLSQWEKRAICFLGAPAPNSICLPKCVCANPPPVCYTAVSPFCLPFLLVRPTPPAWIPKASDPARIRTPPLFWLGFASHLRVIKYAGVGISGVNHGLGCETSAERRLLINFSHENGGFGKAQ